MVLKHDNDMSHVVKVADMCKLDCASLKRQNEQTKTSIKEHATTIKHLSSVSVQSMNKIKTLEQITERHSQSHTKHNVRIEKLEHSLWELDSRLKEHDKKMTNIRKSDNRELE